MKNIDCLIIGHNQSDFSEYEKIRSKGPNSGTYRDLNLNFIRHKGEVYTASGIINKHLSAQDEEFWPLSIGNVFSSTIAYLGTFLNKRGYSYDFINSYREDRDELARKLKENNYLTIAITTTFYVTMYPIIEIMEFIKSHNSNAKIILGGPYISTQVRVLDEASLQYLFNEIGADFYVNSSQGEATLVNILSALKANNQLENVPNITYKNNDDLLTNKVEVENNPLEENTIDWRLFHSHMNKFATVRTSISCPFTCAFCGFPQHAGKYKTIDVSCVESELDNLVSGGNVSCVNIIDDTFNVPPERFKSILRMMIKKKYKFKWNSFFRCQFADEEMIELMKESGCEGVFLGIESGNQQILNNMKKNVKIEKYYKGIELLRKHNIISYASFIVGFPGENEDTAQDTFDFIENTRPDFFRTQLWYCSPFTPIWNQRDEYKIEHSQFEWSHSTMNALQACDIIDNMFMNIKNSIWLPQNDFDYPSVYNLLHRGWKLEDIKYYLNTFNNGVKEKMRSKSGIISELTMLQLKEAVLNGHKEIKSVITN